MKVLILVILLYFPNCYGTKKDVAPVLLLIQEPPLKLNIIGDSLTLYSKGFGLSEKLGSKYEVNHYSYYGRELLEWVIDIDKALINKPDAILVVMGGNDAINRPPSNWKPDYESLLTTLKAKGQFRILLSTIPIPIKPNSQGPIQVMNEIIRNLPEKISDVEPVITEKSKSIPAFSPTDELHPNPWVYEEMGIQYAKDFLSINYL